jgi:hypothetical protein
MAAGEFRAGDAELAAIRFVCGVRRLWRNQIRSRARANGRVAPAADRRLLSVYRHAIRENS